MTITGADCAGSRLPLPPPSRVPSSFPAFFYHFVGNLIVIVYVVFVWI